MEQSARVLAPAVWANKLLSVTAIRLGPYQGQTQRLQSAYRCVPRELRATTISAAINKTIALMPKMI